MPNEPESAIERAVIAIERYLAQHPAAADNAQGIAQWWLGGMGVDASLEQVAAALDILVQRSVIERTPLPAGGAIYRAARRAPAGPGGHRPHNG